MIEELLNHPDFRELVQEMRDDLTKIVMSKGATDEERADAFTKFHLLDSLLTKMGSKIGETNV